jgi:hypothetical protein
MGKQAEQQYKLRGTRADHSSGKLSGYPNLPSGETLHQETEVQGAVCGITVRHEASCAAARAVQSSLTSSAARSTNPTPESSAQDRSLRERSCERNGSQQTIQPRSGLEPVSSRMKTFLDPHGTEPKYALPELHLLDPDFSAMLDQVWRRRFGWRRTIARVAPQTGPGCWHPCPREEESFCC